jgi:hypothetical protein
MPAAPAEPDPAPQPPPIRSQAAATAQAELPTTAADQLAAALAAAIDAASEAETYATRRGLRIHWTSEDIRAMAATLYIQHQRQGGVR